MGRHTRTLSGLIPPLSIIAARHRLGDLATRRPEMSAPMVVGSVILRSEVREARTRSGLLSMFLLSLVATAAAPQTQLHELIARARSLELDTPYVPPPGDPLAHHAAGYAKVICTAVFMTGLAPDFAAENVGYFTAPHEVRTELSKPVIDRTNKAVHITLPNGITRTAKYLGSQGCVTLPLGEDTVHFTPVVVKSKLPNADTMSWPMGDVLPNEPLPGEIDAAKLKRLSTRLSNPPRL